MAYVLRQLRRSPGFFTLVILLLALGISATTQVFTLVDALLLRPLPVQDPQSLVQLYEIHAKRPPDPFFDFPFYKEILNGSSTLGEVFGQIETPHSLDYDGRAERIHAAAVTDNYFSSLGIRALLGKVIGSGDTHVVVLSYAYWSRAFARDPSVLGKAIHLDRHAFTVVGVAPQSFTGTTIDSTPDVWFPYLNLVDLSRVPHPDINQFVIEIMARLRQSGTASQAQQEVAARWYRYRQTNRLLSDSLQVRSIALGISPLRDQARTSLLLLFSGTGLLLLIVCANVGGLLLSRATARQRETAVRIALGANYVQILWPWLLESLFLTSCGGITGVLLAFVTMPFLMRAMPPAHSAGFDPFEQRTLTLHPHIDVRVICFSLLLCLVTALLCAVGPAMRSLQRDINIDLKSSLNEKRGRIFQSGLCAFQIALSTMLLVSAGLIIRSVSNLETSNPGFDREHVAEYSIDPHARGYDSQQTWSFQQRLLSELKKVPGIARTALADKPLMRGIGLGISVVFPGQHGDGIINSSVNSVTPDYFAVMGIHFIAGQSLSPGGHPHAVVVNQAFVRKFLSGRNPMGLEFATGRNFAKPEYRVVGVVSDTRYRSLREIPPPIFYYDGYGPESYPDSFVLHVSTRGDPNGILKPVRQAIASLDPLIPIFHIATLSEEIDRSLWQEHSLAALTSAFGVFALTLSGIALHGILAYFVTRRKREIGLRIALGASAADVVVLVAGRVVPTMAAGMIAGGLLSWMAGIWMRSLLYGVGTFDMPTISLTLCLLMAIGICGAVVPALRAVRVDPATILRHE